MQQSTSDCLPVMEHFFTLQGEGVHAGKAAYFIRLAGCDVGCVWCDVKESWDETLHPLVSISTLCDAVKSSACSLVVITRGEPTLHDMTNLCDELHKLNVQIALETSGTNKLRGKLDWYTFSPKKFKAPIQEAFDIANELKIIINHPSDFAWAEEQAAQTNSNCLLFLQTEWEKSERFLPEIVEYIKNNPKWRLSLQTHKYLNIP